MIPLKIQLKNFISYGADIQTIDFSTYPLICLSGKNGHGKSALLDAITWALWGQARKVTGNSKADQGLLRLGQTQMMVCLDFEFNRQIYRIRREFAVTYGKPYASLDFGTVNEQEQFIPLTDKTISLTQAKIEQTLNLSFDSFANSAFLRQGQANEFSKKSPKDRKEILATILGLDHYDTVRKLAMDKIRQSTTEKSSRQSLQASIEQQLLQVAALQTQLAESQSQLDQCATQEVTWATEKKEIEQVKKKIAQDQQQLNLVEFKLEQLNAQEKEQQHSLRTLWREWRLINKKTSLLPDIQKLESHKKQLVQEINDHQTQLQKSLELKEKHLKYKEEAQALFAKLNEQKLTSINQQKIKIERALFEKQLNQKAFEQNTQKILESSNEKKKIDDQQQVLTQEIKELSQQTSNHLALEKRFEKRKEYYQKFNEQGRWLTGELESLEQKKKLAITDEDPSCPLCEQNLSLARKRFLKSKLADHETIIRHKLTRITKIVKALKALLIEQNKDYELSRKAIELIKLNQTKTIEYDAHSKKITVVLTTLEDQQLVIVKSIKLCDANIAQEQTQLIELSKKDDQTLHAHEPYKKLLDAIAIIEQEAQQQKYNTQLHQLAMKKLQEIEAYINNYNQLIEHVALQTQRQKTIGDLCIILKNSKIQKKILEEELHAYAPLKTQITHIHAQEMNFEKNIQELKQHKEKLLQEKASIQTQLKALDALANEHKEQQKLITLLNETIFEYQAIADAMGKDGIQALLIEDAIPEIEQEANYLLSRLTNNQAQVFIESLRDLKKGGTKETLDIKISDASGIRPYELFSGGEAFRIDFALRIAISKLLARRAGTSLQTLIIDEGFGSQDEEGLSLIMDALYKIQEDFSKIIIVSHLASMKDQFPIHFNIEKGPQGSMVTVFEQG